MPLNKLITRQLYKRSNGSSSRRIVVSFCSSGCSLECCILLESCHHHHHRHRHCHRHRHRTSWNCEKGAHAFSIAELINNGLWCNPGHVFVRNVSYAPRRPLANKAPKMGIIIAMAWRKVTKLHCALRNTWNALSTFSFYWIHHLKSFLNSFNYQKGQAHFHHVFTVKCTYVFKNNTTSIKTLNTLHNC